MSKVSPVAAPAAVLAACALGVAGAVFVAPAQAAGREAAHAVSRHHHPSHHPRHAAARGAGHRAGSTLRPVVGKASFYAGKFAGRKMADGTPMNPHADIAASKTLPLGTKARVTNLETGRSAVVTVRDRGPYVKGRVVDLSPATAQKVGITRKDGVAPVKVTPLSVPPRRDGAGNDKPAAAAAAAASAP